MSERPIPKNYTQWDHTDYSNDLEKYCTQLEAELEKQVQASRKLSVSQVEMIDRLSAENEWLRKALSLCVVKPEHIEEYKELLKEQS